MFKWLKVPVSNETKDVKVAQMWEVRWASVKGHRGLAFGMSNQMADIFDGAANSGCPRLKFSTRSRKLTILPNLCGQLCG